MPRSLEEILAHAAQLADAFEVYEPKPQDKGKAAGLIALHQSVTRRGEADRAVLQAVADAREHDVSWAAIGKVLGTSGEAARQRYGDLVKH